MRTPDRLDAYCWCGRRILRVAAALIRAGETGSCGHADCVPGQVPVLADSSDD